MQTFVPYGQRFADNAKVLDYRRLGKQRVEAWQILQTLTGGSQGWANHPAVKMWEGFEPALCLYGANMCMEWKRRGFVDNMFSRFMEALDSLHIGINTRMPSWLYWEDLQISHRSNLIRKDPEFYGPRWPSVPSTIPYIWPTTEEV